MSNPYFKKPKNMNQDVPDEIWMKNLLASYRKDKDRLEKVSAYAKSLEEENAALRSEVETLRKQKEEAMGTPSEYQAIKSQLQEALSLINKQYPVRKQKLGAYKKYIYALAAYTKELQRKLDRAGIEYVPFRNTLEEEMKDIDESAVSTRNEINRIWRFIFE